MQVVGNGALASAFFTSAPGLRGLTDLSLRNTDVSLLRDRIPCPHSKGSGRIKHSNNQNTKGTLNKSINHYTIAFLF